MCGILVNALVSWSGYSRPVWIFSPCLGATFLFLVKWSKLLTKCMGFKVRTPSAKKYLMFFRFFWVLIFLFKNVWWGVDRHTEARQLQWLKPLLISGMEEWHSSRLKRKDGDVSWYLGKGWVWVKFFRSHFFFVSIPGLKHLLFSISSLMPFSFHPWTFLVDTDGIWTLIDSMSNSERFSVFELQIFETQLFMNWRPLQNMPHYRTKSL